MPDPRLLLLLVLAALLGMGLYHSFKPLPPGISYSGSEYPLSDPRFFRDMTGHGEEGELKMDQQIFDEILRLIGQAQRLVVLDMFLFNDSTPPDSNHRPIARQLTEALVERAAAISDLRVVVITDPLNTVYGGQRSAHFEQLRAAGIRVIETNLRPLRDSNPLWSSIWRLCCQWLGNNPEGGWLPNATGDGRVTLRSYLALLNFKANHRKTLIVDEGEGLRALVTSANPHDGSSRHSNVALTFGGPAVIDLLETERAVAALSDAQDALPELPLPDTVSSDGEQAPVRGRIVTEGKILQAALGMIQTAEAGSELDLAMFYLSHRELVTALRRAAERGVRLRLLLDANKDAFGLEKSGIPNRPVAMELHSNGIPVRWCHTRGEQCHSKFLLRRDDTGGWQALLGSANFTRRNLDNLNLETDVHFSGPAGHPLIGEMTNLFNQYWTQGADQSLIRSLPHSAYADESRLRYWQYRLMERTGLSTF